MHHVQAGHWGIKTLINTNSYKYQTLINTKLLQLPTLVYKMHTVAGPHVAAWQHRHVLIWRFQQERHRVCLSLHLDAGGFKLMSSWPHIVLDTRCQSLPYLIPKKGTATVRNTCHYQGNIAQTYACNMQTVPGLIKDKLCMCKDTAQWCQNRMPDLGLMARMAFPIRCAASRQSVSAQPSPHVARPCGSLLRSAPMTFQLSLYLPCHTKKINNRARYLLMHWGQMCIFVLKTDRCCALSMCSNKVLHVSPQRAVQHWDPQSHTQKD